MNVIWQLSNEVNFINEHKQTKIEEMSQWQSTFLKLFLPFPALWLKYSLSPLKLFYRRWLGKWLFQGLLLLLVKGMSYDEHQEVNYFRKIN